jgi:hypothetical protein
MVATTRSPSDLAPFMQHATRSLDDVRVAWRRMEALGSGAVPTTAIGASVALSPERVARKLKTTAELLVGRGHLPRQLREALDDYCRIIAEAMQVAPCDAHATRARDARRIWKIVEQHLPVEFMDVVEQLVSEEIGLLDGRPQSLRRFGRELAWQQDKQAADAPRRVHPSVTTPKKTKSGQCRTAPHWGALPLHIAKRARARYDVFH